jgi:hypothetical protein
MKKHKKVSGYKTKLKTMIRAETEQSLAHLQMG